MTTTLNRVTLFPATEAEWLKMREQDITSTEAAGLFECSPYTTEYELYHVKTGQLVMPFESNERVVWGQRLEGAIAAGMAEDYGLEIVPFKSYMRIPELRLGSSFDFKIIGITPGWKSRQAGDQIYRDAFLANGPGILEIKNVDGRQFKRGWLAGEAAEAPPHIELQVQHQQLVAGLDWTMVAPLIGGNTPVPFLRLHDDDIGRAILAKVAAFWQRVDDGKPPQPNYEKDGETIKRLRVNNDGTSIDLSADARLAQLCRIYKEQAAISKAADTAKDAARAEILDIIRSAKSVAVAGGKISAGTRGASFRSFDRETREEIRIAFYTVEGGHTEYEIPAFRDVRITLEK